MFDLQCIEYLKEISQDPQNTNLREKLLQLVAQNPNSVEPFIEKFQLNIEQKQLLLELLQEVQNNSGNSQKNNVSGQQLNEFNKQPNNQFSENSFYDTVFEYFTPWRDEYLKYQKITQQCIDIIEKLIQQHFWNNQENIEIFLSLPTQYNDAFIKFKNHVINILCVHLIEEIDREITLLKSSSISYFKKYILLFKFEKLENSIKKKKIQFKQLKTLQDESLRLRNESN